MKSGQLGAKQQHFAVVRLLFFYFIVQLNN